MASTQTAQSAPHTRHFTADFHSGHADTWAKIMAPMRGLPVSVLEVGSYEGCSATWLLENVLDHPESRITCVDSFVGVAQHNTDDPNMASQTLLQRFQANMAPWGDKVRLLQGDSKSVLKKLPESEYFDMIYIDGDHTAAGVLADAVLAWPHLKYGGLMIFDDYLWLAGEPRRWWGPKEGIDAFVSCYRDQLHVALAGAQLMISKI